MRDRERFSPAQSRAARGLLGWSQQEAASAAGLKIEAIELYEQSDGGFNEGEMWRLGAAFHRQGVIALAESLGGEGVRRTRPQSRRGG